MNQPRFLPDVIDALVAVIPVEETNLLADLAKARSSALFCAPEAMPGFWNDCAEALERSLRTREQTGWVAEVAAIFVGRTS